MVRWSASNRYDHADSPDTTQRETHGTILPPSHLGLKNNLLGYTLALIVLPQLGTVVMAPKFGKLTDRIGVKRVLRITHTSVVFVPLFWILAPQANPLYVLPIGALLAGICVSGMVNAGSKVVTRIPPPDSIAMYVATSACLDSLATGVAALSAGLLLESLEGVEWVIGGKTLVGFHILFASSFVMRLGTTFLIPRLTEPEPD